MSNNDNKRSYDEFRSDYKQLKREINEREEKRQRLQEEMDEAYPRKRQEAMIAKAKAKEVRENREVLEKTLPEPLKQVLLNSAARAAWPDLGSLVAMTVEPDVDPVSDHRSTDVVRVYLTFERGSHRTFLGVIYPRTGFSYPSNNWEENTEDETLFKPDPWTWALKRQDGDPVHALFELIVHGVMALVGTDDALKLEDVLELDALHRMWAQVYPAAKKEEEGEEED
jgi:hypothetical protein